jgi:hypothetical protein
MQAAGDITLPDIPHDSNVSRNNGKKEFSANFPHASLSCGSQRVTMHEAFARDGRFA